MTRHGLLLVDKPADLTSHDVVARVRRMVGQKAVGHTGTLDPIATGLMVMVLGDATKLSDYLVAEDKTYEVKVRFGVTTDTLDRTGKVLSRTSCDGLSPAAIRDAVAALSGDFSWPVPLFSATKIDGRKLYEFGRAGRPVELPTKRMSFRDLELTEVGGDFARVRMRCTKGSFVRTWANELGRALGVGGMVEELNREGVGPWSVGRAAKLSAEVPAGGGDDHGLGEAFIPMGAALPGLKAVMAGPRDHKLVGHGQIPRAIENRLIVEQKRAFDQQRSVFVKVVSEGGDLLAILAAEPGRGLKIKRVFRAFA